MTTTVEPTSTTTTCPPWCVEHRDGTSATVHLSRKSKWAANLRVAVSLREGSREAFVSVVDPSVTVECLSVGQARKLARALLAAAALAEVTR